MYDSFIWLIVAHICMAVQKIALVALRGKEAGKTDSRSVYVFIYGLAYNNVILAPSTNGWCQDFHRLKKHYFHVGDGSVMT